MANIITAVLKTNGTYTHTYVNNLAKQVKSCMRGPYEFVLLTDNSENIDMDFVDRIIPLEHNFESWWCKIELFSPGKFPPDSRVLFFDLDTIILDDITPFFSLQESFYALEDFYFPKTIGSGVMLWTPSESTNLIYNNFITSPRMHMNRCVKGDQEWILKTLPHEMINKFQDFLPNKIVSLKKHCLQKDKVTVNIPEGTAVLCFHGNPRPHALCRTSDVIKGYWNPNL